MSKHTTFRIGGPAEVFMNPTLEELQSVLAFCKEREIPVTIVGNGSNLLVSDDGISGVVIKIGSNMADIEVSGHEIYAEAGAMLAAVARTAEKHNLAGMEFASGIPGSLGGGCIMNAGAYGGELKDILTEITVITKDGEVQTIPAAEAGLEYRHSRFMESGEIVIAAKMLLTDGVEEEIREKSRGFNQSRRDKQPLNFPSAGSTFKRPEGNFAGKLIEDSGLK
jgi:UDP-N-acetylmuramate dehydrogenase